MNQQLRTEPRETGLTTADLAKSNKPISSNDEIDRSTETSTTRHANNGRADRDSLYAQEQAPFPQEPYGRNLEQPSTDVLDGSTTTSSEEKD